MELMPRFLGALTFALSLLAANAADAAPSRGPTLSPRTRSVPELSATGSAAGLAIIGGAAAIAFGRRRARKS
jgi:hypothetical protein